jgi:hypothetical protein
VLADEGAVFGRVGGEPGVLPAEREDRRAARAAATDTQVVKRSTSTIITNTRACSASARSPSSPLPKRTS